MLAADAHFTPNNVEMAPDVSFNIELLIRTTSGIGLVEEAKDNNNNPNKCLMMTHIPN